MQRVVRLSLVGLLTIAGLTACGDKVTVPGPTNAPVDNVVHSVTVSPSSVTIQVGGSLTLGVSVDAGAGVTVRTVTWTSSDATVATVDATGKVTGVKAGTTSIVAAATADPNVKGAAVVTVGGGLPTQPPTVTIASINQTICAAPGPNIVPPCATAPANLSNFGTAAGATGQLDVTLNVEANGQILRTVSATLKCGNDVMTQTQTLSAAASADAVPAEEAAAPVTLSFNTTQFNSTTGAVSLHNNAACTLSATATTASGTPAAANSQVLQLNNADGVVTAVTFAGGATAADTFKLPWKSGAATVSAIPVLYSGRVPATISIRLCGNPGCPVQPNVPTQTVPAVLTGATTATWSTATSGAAPRIGQLTITGGPDPLQPGTGATIAALPAVTAIDTFGNDIALANLNSPLGANPAAFRADNQSPDAPTTFQIPVRQGGWVGASPPMAAAYTFAGTGGAPGSATGKYMAGANTGANGPNAIGFGDQGVGFSIGTSGGSDPQNTLTWFYAPTASFVPLVNTIGPVTPGTAIAADCVTTGLTQITNGNDIPASANNTAYSIRAVEKDRLGNTRCADLGLTGAPVATFGVDKGAPTAVFVEPAADPTAAGPNQAVSCASAAVASPCPGIAVPNFRVALTDDASGFSATPMVTKVTRLAINPLGLYGGVAGTGVTATPNDVNGFGCPVGFDAANLVCSTEATGFVLPVDGQHTTPPSTGAIISSGVDGYYTITTNALDLARNPSASLTRAVVVDRQAPTMGGIQVPAAIIGGVSASFPTSATDNLDLTTTDYTLSYPATPTGSPTQLNIRATGPNIGTAFDNVLTTSSSFSVNVPFFIRNMATTGAGDAPQDNGVPPNQIAVRAYDAGSNVSAPGVSAIQAANVPQTTPQSANVHTSYAAPQANGATFQSFKVSNAAASVSNCPAAGCAGGVAPANATTVQLTAQATGTEQAGPPTFQLLNPFTQVQFYYFDPATNEWTLINTTTAPTVTDDATATHRTFTWTLAPFDPPAALAPGALRVIAVGTNAAGDALSTAVSTAILLTNP